MRRRLGHVQNLRDDGKLSEDLAFGRIARIARIMASHRSGEMAWFDQLCVVRREPRYDA